MHRDLLLPCGFLPECKKPELQPATPEQRSQTHSLKEPVVDPEENLREEEERRIPQVPIPATAKLRVDGSLPAQSSPTNPTVAEPVHSPAWNLLVVEGFSLVTDAVDPSLLNIEEDVSEASEKEDGGCLPEPGEVSSTPETLPFDEDVELGGPIETSPDSGLISHHATETPVAVTNSGGGVIWMLLSQSTTSSRV